MDPKANYKIFLLSFPPFIVSRNNTQKAVKKHNQGTLTVAYERKIKHRTKNPSHLKKHRTKKAQVKTIYHNENILLTEPKARKHSEGLWWPTKGHNPDNHRNIYRDIGY